MFDVSGLEHLEYKPGVEYVKAGNKFLLDQNPDTHSSYAYAAKSGHKIQWELSEKPVAGEKLAYTGKVILDGKLMDRDDASALLRK